ncbi:MAG: UDP-3-O-[3-hydroxymyristoyl] N-acetylglucosamine deacetylase [Chitinophagaceae bacterium]|nr:UDP-3-O-[3-hydroxymyristoyl] N-acetylglucosamine deacetylase [Oligoflexus sp.]
MRAAHTIFVVDDQESILSSVKSVLGDESYRILIFSSAEALEEGLQLEKPDLILLDIWLPGIDGVEALTKLKTRFPDMPVILMSGHAGIDIAVKAMKAGASDFLEKPLNLDILLEKVAVHLPRRDSSLLRTASTVPEHLATLMKGDAARLAPSTQPQRTVKKNAVLNGVGLLSGRPTGVIISPAPVDTGIIFRTLDGVAIPGHITALDNFDRLGEGKSFTANSTVLAKGGRRIRTVEHLLAALNMMGITNASIKVDEEIPNIDGSAADFCRIIEAAGIEDQGKPRMDIVIRKKIMIGNDESVAEKYLYVEPFDGFEVDMRVDYPAPILEQKFRFSPDEHSFESEIATARSFNTFENIDIAQQRGMAGSGYLNSHIIIHDGKVINTKLNFPDEFVRHKILDLLGDLYLLGYGLRGRVVGNMTSHGLNQSLARKIHEALSQDLVS